MRPAFECGSRIPYSVVRHFDWVLLSPWAYRSTQACRGVQGKLQLVETNRNFPAGDSFLVTGRQHSVNTKIGGYLRVLNPPSEYSGRANRNESARELLETSSSVSAHHAGNMVNHPLAKIILSFVGQRRGCRLVATLMDSLRCRQVA